MNRQYPRFAESREPPKKVANKKSGQLLINANIKPAGNTTLDSAHQAAKNNLHDSCSIHPDKSNTWKIDQQSPIFNRLRFFDQSCLSRAAEAWHQTPARYASLSAKCLSSEQVKAHWLGRRRRRSPLRCCCAPLRLPFSAPGPRCSSLQS